MSLIPEKINNFNVYLDTVKAANRIIGVTDEVTLPNFECMTETLSMAGMGGEIDSPVAGQFQSVTIEIPFSNITTKMLELASDDSKAIIMRAAQEVVDDSTNKKSYKGIVITVRGMTKSVNYGNLKKGGYGNPSITKEVTAFKAVYDGKTLTDINKWSTKCIMNGVNIAKGISDLL